MEIPVRLQARGIDNSIAVELWVIALDGSDRTWFKWYENEGIAFMDAENMRLVEVPVLVTPSDSRYAVNVHRRLREQTAMQEDDLDTHWVKGPKARPD
jgi:LPS sulfotransferase NodH